MQISSLARQHQRLIWLVSQTQHLRGDQLELQSHWGRYLCVLTAGFIENALGEIYSEYARVCSNTNVANYVQSIVLTIKTPKAKRFVETARAFDKGWAEDLEKFLASNGRKEAIDGIMSNRHLIAHGKDSGITVMRVSDYLKKVVEVIEYLEQQCGLEAS